MKRLLVILGLFFILGTGLSSCVVSAYPGGYYGGYGRPYWGAWGAHHGGYYHGHGGYRGHGHYGGHGGYHGR